MCVWVTLALQLLSGGLTGMLPSPTLPSQPICGGSTASPPSPSWPHNLSLRATRLPQDPHIFFWGGQPLHGEKRKPHGLYYLPTRLPYAYPHVPLKRSWFTLAAPRPKWNNMDSITQCFWGSDAGRGKQIVLVLQASCVLL